MNPLYNNKADFSDYENMMFENEEGLTVSLPKKTGKTMHCSPKKDILKSSEMNLVECSEDKADYEDILKKDQWRINRVKSSKEICCLSAPVMRCFVVVLICAIIVILVLFTWTSLQNKTDHVTDSTASSSRLMQGMRVSMKENGNMTYSQKYYFNIGMKNDYRLQECQGPQLKRSFPNIDYALLGYNILKGFPMATGHDPGFTMPIFTANYFEGRQTADCRFSIPNGYVIIPDVSCITSFSSKTIKSRYEFAQSLSVDVNANAGVWGASFSASAGYRQASSRVSTGEHVMILSTAKCDYFFSKLNAYDPPTFHPTFIHWINVLERSNNPTDFNDFFDTFGTHFPTMITFGARFTYEHTMSSKAFEQKRQQGINIGVQASYAGVVSVGGGFNLDSSQQQQASQFMSEVDTRTITVGAAPPANGDALTWASNVKENPIPTKYTLQSIEELFTEKYMRSLNVKYWDINRKIRRHKTGYCTMLRERGDVDSCRGLEPGLMLQNVRLSSIFMEMKLSKSDCVQKCIDRTDCIAIDYCYKCSSGDRDYMTCRMYGRNLSSKNTYISSSDRYELVIFNSKITFNEELKDAAITGTRRQAANVTVDTADEQTCLNACKDDIHCAAVTYNHDAASGSQTVCMMYAEVGIKSLKVQYRSKTYIVHHAMPDQVSQTP